MTTIAPSPSPSTPVNVARPMTVAIAYLLAALIGGFVTGDSLATWSWASLVSVGCIAIVVGVVVATNSRAPTLWFVVAATTGAIAFLAWAGADGSTMRLLVAASGLVVLVAVGPTPRRRLIILVAVAPAIAAVDLILIRDHWLNQAHTLVALSTGLLWGVGVFWTLWDLRPAATPADPLADSLPTANATAADVSGTSTPLFAAKPHFGTKQQWHGWSLVLTAAMLPVGEGVAFGAAGLCLIMMIVRRDAVPFAAILKGNGRLFAIGFGLWIGMALVAAVISGHGLLEPRELGRLAPWLLFPLAFWSVLSLPAVWLERTLRGFFVGLGIACLVGLSLYGLNLLGSSTGSTVSPHEWADSLRLSLLKGSQSRIPGTSDQLVAGGFFRHRLKMAHVAVLGISILVSRQLVIPFKLKPRLLELALIILSTATLLLTFTRGAVLGVLVAVAVAIWMGSPRWRLRAVIAAVIVATIALSAPTVRNRIASIGSRSTGLDRAFLWAQGVELLADHPLGAGLANYPTLSEQYYTAAGSLYNVPRTYPHSLVLAAWAEAGPVGLGGYITMWLALALAALRGARRREDRLIHLRRGEHVRAAGTALLCTIGAFWTLGITHDVLFHKPVALAFATLVGAFMAELHRETSADARPAAR